MEIQALSPEVIQDTQIPPTATDFIPADLIDSTFSTNIDLISRPLGSQILAFSDEFFASASNLINPSPPIHRPGHFVPTGAWYDGWETRRHNSAPFDWVIVRLGVASGKTKGIEIDTAYFDGNHAEAVAVQGVFVTESNADEKVKGFGDEEWQKGELLGMKECGPSRRQAWKIQDGREITHVRLCMYPDGGIARFRLYGEAIPIFPEDKTEEVELSAAVMGGVAVACSDEHFGKKGNLLLPGRGVDMGDGWETKRSREKGHEDWVVVKLGARGRVRMVVVDTMHFRGNYPKAVKIEGADAGGMEVLNGNDGRWEELVEEQYELGPDRVHEYGEEVFHGEEAFTHMKLTILPDGGVKRFRVFGLRV